MASGGVTYLLITGSIRSQFHLTRRCNSISMQDASKPGSPFIRPANDAAAWFPTSQPAPDAPMRLFCFPYAGAGIPVFRAWPNLFTQKIELRVAQLPGR